MFWENKKEIVLGKVHRELRLVRRFGVLRWRWKRRYFKSMRLDPAHNLNPHIMITGESGAGKSNVAKLILKQLAGTGANFIVLDPHSEYAEHAKDIGASVYDAGIHAINPFDLDGLTERERTAEIAGMLRRILHLGEVQYSMLHRCIGYTYWISLQKDAEPTMRGLLFSIKRFKANARSRPEANILDGLEKRLAAITSESFARSVSIGRIMGARSIFSLASLHSHEAQSIYIESMLRKVYTNMLAGPLEEDRSKGGRRTFYLVIDEAEKLQDSPVIGRLVAEGRKYGIGIIAISQRAKVLSKEIRSNSATMIAFAQREPEEQNYVANMVAAGTEYNRFMEVRKVMRELPRGYALVQVAKEKTKIVRCTRFEARTKDPSYRIIELAKKVVGRRELVEKLEKEGFSEEETINAATGLIKSGLLKYHAVTETPYEGIWYITMPRNSAEHDIMVHLISRYLNEHGIPGRVYNSSYGPDVIAYSNGKRVAVEYETGAKRAGETERMLAERRKKFGSVVVLGNSGSAEEKA